MSSHHILGGRVQVFKRGGSRFWHCRGSIKGDQHRSTTGHEDEKAADKFAEEWYLGLLGADRAGTLKKPSEKTLQQAADVFVEEYKASVEGQRSPAWVKSHDSRIRRHLNPYFGDMALTKITSGTAHDYRIHRSEQKIVRPDPMKKGEKIAKSPALSTVHDEIVTLRMILKCAHRRGWIASLPDLSPAYRGNGKVSARPWFSPAEYKTLYEASRIYAERPHEKRFRWNAEQVHDFILFMGNTGLRPDEAAPRNLLHRDVSIILDEDTGEEILQIEVRGKVGVGYCKSMPGAVHPYRRLLGRPLPNDTSQTKRARRRRREVGPPPPVIERYPQPEDPVFPGNHAHLFNGILHRANLKYDRAGKARTAYSLRHTYICMRLMDGADIYQVAKNCRTSVEMIQAFYASHIANAINAADINVRRPRRRNAVPQAAE